MEAEGKAHKKEALQTNCACSCYFLVEYTESLVGLVLFFLGCPSRPTGLVRISLKGVEGTHEVDKGWTKLPLEETRHIIVNEKICSKIHGGLFFSLQFAPMAMRAS